MLDSDVERRKAKPSFFFLSLFFFLGLFNSVSPVFGGYDGVRWALLLILPVVILICLYAGSAVPKAVIVLILVAAGAGSYLFPLTPPYVYSIFEAQYWLASLLLAGLISRKQSLEFILSKARTLVIVALCFASIYVLTIVMGLLFWYEQGGGKVTDFLPFGFYNIRMWSHIATWIIPLCCSCIFLVQEKLASRRRVVTIWAIVVLGFWFMVLLGSAARGSMLAHGLAFVLMLALYRQRFWNIGKFWVYGFIFGAFLYFIFVIAVPKALFEQLGYYQVFRTGGSGRGQLWAYALSLSLESFPFGAGPLSYSYRTPVDAYATPHSLYFTWASEYGWLFVVAVAVIFIRFSFRAWSNANVLPPEGSGLKLGVQFSVLSAFIHACVSGVFTSPVSQIVGFPILAIYFAFCLDANKNFRPAISRGRFINYFALLFFGLSVFIIYPSYNWWHSSKQDAVPYMERNHIGLAPRFWIHGRFVGNEDRE